MLKIYTIKIVQVFYSFEFYLTMIIQFVTAFIPFLSRDKMKSRETGRKVLRDSSSMSGGSFVDFDISYLDK